MRKAKTHTPIKSFIKRSGAFIIDLLLIGGILQIFALSFFDLAMQTGPFGRLIGFFPALIYFSILNSSLRKGQTIGEQILKLSVIDKDRNPISLQQSFLRSLIGILPIAVYKLDVPFIRDQPALFALLNGLSIGAFLVNVYLFLFNQKTYQLFPDIICGTYVIPKNIASRNSLESSLLLPPDLYKRLSYGLLIGTTLLFLGNAIFFTKQTVGEDGQRLQKAVLADGTFYDADITVHIFSDTDGKPLYFINMEVWTKRDFTNDEATIIIDEIAKTLLANNVIFSDSYDGLRIQLVAKYDLFFAFGSRRYAQAFLFDQWLDRLEISP